MSNYSKKEWRKMQNRKERRKNKMSLIDTFYQIRNIYYQDFYDYIEWVNDQYSKRG